MVMYILGISSVVRTNYRRPLAWDPDDFADWRAESHNRDLY
jgi:hypothetical protein